MSNLQARNEIVINAPVSQIWAIITDTNQLDKVHPRIVKATGIWNEKNCTRICESKNGTMTEKIIEIIPEKKIVWTTESDTMGMKKTMKEIAFYFYLEAIGGNRTKVIHETHYMPANFFIRILNNVMMKKMISKLQAQTLNNIKTLAEK